MAAIIVKGGNILSIGYNRIGDHPGAYYGNSFHAEHDAIRKCGNKEALKGAKMFVYRFARGDPLASSSKPCERCQRHIRDAGISRVIFVDNKGVISKESYLGDPDRPRPHLRHLQFGTTSCY